MHTDTRTHADICTHILANSHTYTRMRTHVCSDIHTYTHTHIDICALAFTSTHMHTCVLTCTCWTRPWSLWLLILLNMRACTHTHTHTHTHKHTHTNAHLCRFGQDPKALGYSHPFVLEPARLRRKHKHAKLLKPSLGKSLMPVCLCAFVYMYGCAHVCTYVWMIYFCWCVTAMSV